MSISSIGVQTISPQSGTNWQRANPPEETNNDTDGKDKPAPPVRAPTNQDTGKLVDKTA
jgi:hypothetical protein